jgi:hypothetical protein
MVMRSSRHPLLENLKKVRSPFIAFTVNHSDCTTSRRGKFALILLVMFSSHVAEHSRLARASSRVTQFDRRS